MLDKEYLLDALEYYSLETNELERVYFAGEFPAPPPLAYQVHFSRIEMVLIGELEMEVGSRSGEDTVYHFQRGSVLYLPAESWNKPNWNKPVITMTILIGKQNFGISLISWDGKQFDSVIKESIPRKGPRTGSFILHAIEELSSHDEDRQTSRQLVRSLFSHIIYLINNPSCTPSKSHALFEAVKDYLDIHYSDDITRDSVARHFHISPNYLSQLFQKEGVVKFNEYLNHVRLEQAKRLLKRHDFKVKEVATRCGFNNSNYFCRLFKKETECSPIEYRTRHQHTH